MVLDGSFYCPTCLARLAFDYRCLSTREPVAGREDKLSSRDVLEANT